MINSAQHYPVHVLLNHEDKIQYRIPKYQREYTWQKPQWEALFQDLVEADGSHFLGTIITLNQTVDAADTVVLEVIDGQQRLTTLTLLLAAIFKILSAEEEPDIDAIVERGNLGNRLVRKETGQLRVVPQVQGLNLADYVTTLSKAGLKVAADQKNYYGLRRVARCYEYFSRSLTELAEFEGVSALEVARRMLKAVMDAVMVKIEVASYADAFVLFESLNNRGMPLTPVDLIKNHLLAEAERGEVMSVDEAFESWNSMLSNLGDDSSTHDRFLRHFYNAFRGELPTVPGVATATKGSLIKIYQRLLTGGFDTTLDSMVAASGLYGRIAGGRAADAPTKLDDAMRRLVRAQGVPSHMLLLWLMSKQNDIELSEPQLIEVADVLVSFFVRRNLSGLPPTNALTRLFMGTIDELAGATGKEIVEIIKARLKSVSVSDEVFREGLTGAIYNVNSDIARFVLVSLEESSMTDENRKDLWEEDGGRFVWTIEHIFPQGANLPESWKEMMGGANAAAAAQEAVVHRLGNLTITRYNPSLSNMPFLEKRNRQDKNGLPIGYRNGLWLNQELAVRESWTIADIDERTTELADKVLQKFPLD